MNKRHDCTTELRSVGSRATAGRLALLKLLERASAPLSVPEIEQALTLNRVTIYRALDALVEAGLARRGTSGRVAYFSYAGKPHHHHLVCVGCGFEKSCVAC